MDNVLKRIGAGAAWTSGRRGIKSWTGFLLVIALVWVVPPVGSERPAAADEDSPTVPTLPPLADSPDAGVDAPTLPFGDFRQAPSLDGLTPLPDDPTRPGLPVPPGSVVSRTLTSTTYDVGDGL